MSARADADQSRQSARVFPTHVNFLINFLTHSDRALLSPGEGWFTGQPADGLVSYHYYVNLVVDTRVSGMLIWAVGISQYRSQDLDPRRIRLSLFTA